MAIGGTPYTFGGYVFPENVIEFTDNFTNTLPDNTRLPGVDGAWSNDGMNPAVTEIGSVRVRFYLTPSQRADMDGFRDTLRAVAAQGIQKLTYTPTKAGDARRFTYARIQNIQMPRVARDFSDTYQECTITFQCPSPFWLVDRYAGWRIGDEHTIGEAGLHIGDGGLSFAASGLETSQTVTNLGSAFAYCVVDIQPQGGQTCHAPRVRRVDGGSVLDEFQYTGTLTALQTLSVNGIGQIVKKDAVDVYDSFTFQSPAFLRLAPGANTIKVLFGLVGDAATVTIFYYDTYR